MICRILIYLTLTTLFVLCNQSDALAYQYAHKNNSTRSLQAQPKKKLFRKGLLKDIFKKKSNVVTIQVVTIDTVSQDTTVSTIQVDRKEINRKKRNAVLLALALGPFGVHRLYLGTDAKVPVVYTLTLGGGFGILPLIDIVAILASNDLKEFTHNNKIMMWVK